MTSLILFLALFILIAYAFRLNHYSAFEDIQEKQLEHKPPVTLIIPFKNEEGNLPALLSALEGQNYPTDKFTVLFVNDHSTDEGITLIEAAIKKHSNYHLLLNELTGKKAALLTGVEQAQTDWIISTDADCIPAPTWLQTMTGSFTEDTLFVAGPVKLNSSKPGSWLQQLLTLEHLALQRLTYLSIRKEQPLMANGANMAYRKEAFLDAAQADLNMPIASGDDTFLLFHCYNKNPKSCKAITDTGALVTTQSANSYGKAVRQRTRWAGKIKAYTNLWHVKETGLIFLLANLMLPILFFQDATSKIRYSMILYWFLKTAVDYYFTRPLATRFNQPISFSRVFLLGLLYPFFLLDIVVRAWFTPLKKQ
jgi:cellulose synthase/poly-beta-1,6-N-acetylglucosamine synthase-like glycosyltransferase